ncbi:MAG: DUF624 domain-containing protein [Ruminococcaceae bacterium]|nr:DUF624 domain-containing protein [Oscillospiraceae bacterium]
MALFGMFNYAKPGKGVSKDAPEKHRFFLFFELFFRKISKLILLNLMLAVITFPLVATGIIWLMALLQIDLSSFTGDFNIALFLSFMGLPFPVPQILTLLSAVLMGPATAAATYIWRNFARQEHSWVWTDFWERMKSNFRQGLIFGLIDLVILVCFVLYITVGAINNPMLNQYLVLFRYVAIFAVIIYLFMRNYTYLIAVTFEMSIFAILRNSWIFAVLGFVRNLCTLVFSALVLFITSYVPLPMMLIFTYSLCGFISTFNAWPVIEKFMLSTRVQNTDGSISFADPSELPEPEKETVFTDDMSPSPNRPRQDDEQ